MYRHIQIFSIQLSLYNIGSCQACKDRICCFSRCKYFVIAVGVNHIISYTLVVHQSPFLRNIVHREQLCIFCNASIQTVTCSINSNHLCNRDRNIQIYISIIFSNIFDLRVFFDYLGRNDIVGFSIIIRCVVRLMANDVYFTYRKFVGYRIMICQICHG